MLWSHIWLEVCDRLIEYSKPNSISSSFDPFEKHLVYIYIYSFCRKCHHPWIYIKQLLGYPKLQTQEPNEHDIMQSYASLFYFTVYPIWIERNNTRISVERLMQYISPSQQNPWLERSWSVSDDDIKLNQSIYVYLERNNLFWFEHYP